MEVDGNWSGLLSARDWLLLSPSTVMAASIVAEHQQRHAMPSAGRLRATIPYDPDFHFFQLGSVFHQHQSGTTCLPL